MLRLPDRPARRRPNIFRMQGGSMTTHGVCTVAALAALAGSIAEAAAQTVHAPVRVNPPSSNIPYRNATIAVSPTGEVVAAAVEGHFVGDRISYGISFDNGATFPHRAVLNGGGFTDPSVVFGDGRFWLTAAHDPSQVRLGVSVKDAGATSFPSAVALKATGNAPASQPRAAAGPDPLDPSRTRVYIVHSNGTPDQTLGCSGEQMRLMAAARWEGPGDADWTAGLRLGPPGNPCEYVGSAPAAAVTDAGRVLAVSADRALLSGDSYTESWRNGGLPWVVYSDDGGDTWPLPKPILLGESADPPIVGPQAGDAIAIDDGAHLPGIAVKRRPGDGAPDHAYVIFIARSPDPSATDLDLYISRSVNDGQTFPSAPVAGNPNPNLVHLNDLDLHAGPPAPVPLDQVMPSIAAGLGDNDVHFFWYETEGLPSVGGDPYLTRVYYGRIRHYGTPGQTLTVLPLNEFSASTGDPRLVRDFGGRQQIVVRKAGRDVWIYCAYAAMTEDNGPSFIVQRVKWANELRPADFNGDGPVEADDLTLFQAAYNAQDPSADLTGDGVVDPQDQAAFQDAYAAGRAQP